MFRTGDRVRIKPTFTFSFDGMVGTVVNMRPDCEWDCAVHFDGDLPDSSFMFKFVELEALDGPW